jgi:hypothetical protein
MSKKISVHVDLMESDKELDEILDNCKTKIASTQEHPHYNVMAR